MLSAVDKVDENRDAAASGLESAARRQGAVPRNVQGSWRLRAFRGFSADARSLGLAYAEAMRLLKGATQAARQHMQQEAA
jgi:hypothetical protein